MIEVYINLGLDTYVTNDVESNYYTIYSNQVPVCSFYIDEDKLPYNSVLCFSNEEGIHSYITFFKEYLQVVHNSITVYSYSKESIQAAFNTFDIKVIEE